MFRLIFGAITLGLCLAALGLFVLADTTGDMEFGMHGVLALLMAIPCLFLALPEQPPRYR